VWQSLQPTIVTRYLPRSAEGIKAVVPVAAFEESTVVVSAGFGLHPTITPASNKQNPKETMLLFLMVVYGDEVDE
jgi:hypothetical protein